MTFGEYILGRSYLSTGTVKQLVTTMDTSITYGEQFGSNMVEEQMSANHVIMSFKADITEELSTGALYSDTFSADITE